jgi:hypothetical protein
VCECVCVCVCVCVCESVLCVCARMGARLQGGGMMGNMKSK